LSRLRKFLTGLTIPQEYVCVPLEDFQQPLRIFLTLSKNDFSLEVTASHVFLGYKPLIIAITLPSSENALTVIRHEDYVCLNFSQHPFTRNYRWNGFFSNKLCVARLVLKKIREKEVDGNHVIFYEGHYGEHSFLNSWHQFVNRQRHRMRKDVSGNVGLNGNLYDQVRIAYAVPRIIPLITITDGHLLNMFPTDLHGPIGSEFYMSSLRKGGKANAQVEQHKKLALSRIDVADFKIAYLLGKNHMQDLRATSSFTSAKQSSRINNIPLPAAVLSYRELNQIESFDVGIHKIHLYENVHEESVHNGMTLSHIHQFYAQWRSDHNIPTNMRLR
jgi:hypothetical protein